MRVEGDDEDPYREKGENKSEKGKVAFPKSAERVSS